MSLKPQMHEFVDSACELCLTAGVSPPESPGHEQGGVRRSARVEAGQPEEIQRALLTGDVQHSFYFSLFFQRCFYAHAADAREQLLPSRSVTAAMRRRGTSAFHAADLHPLCAPVAVLRERSGAGCWDLCVNSAPL